MATEAVVLVTRPEGQAGPLLSALARNGWRGVHQPLLLLRPVEVLSAAARQHVQDLDQYQHVIFISANAVRFGLEVIDDYWPQLPGGVNWYAIGDSTAALLRERGLSPLTPGQKMTSEGLLALPELQQPEGDRVLLVKGIGGRQTLRDVLAERGARVDQLACYQRQCPDLPAGRLAELLQSRGLRAVMISSGEGLKNMLTLLSDKETTKFRDINLIVPSDRVAEEAQEAGFSHVTTAANASDGAMLEALLQRRVGE